MNRSITTLIDWEIINDGILDEIGIYSQNVTLHFSSIDSKDTVQKTHPIIAASEHFIATEKFVLKRDSWSTKGHGEDSYLNCYQVLELLEKAVQ